MAAGKLIALEWDDREARVAVATPRGSDIIVEDAFAVDISAATSDDATSNVAEIGRRVAEALSQRDLRGCDVLLGLGRTSIELRSLSLPKCPPEEIPDMVRFQALQAFTAIGDDWPLDYVELGEQEDAINVLAAVLSPKQVAQMRQVCAASELTPRCLVLRPFAAASLLHRAGVLQDDKSALIIDMLADGADLTAVADGQVTFMRTVRLPATTDEAVQARSLLGEVRRTIAAAQAQEGAQRIERIVICGAAAEHALLMQSLTESLQLEVLPFDPFQVVQVSSRLSRSSLTDVGRYAPLLGMLADHAAGTRHAIDFLNPRKRPAPPSTRRRNVLIASGVMAGALIVFGGIGAGLKHYDNKIASLAGQIAELNQGVDRAKVLIANADAVKEFTDEDVTLLDELYEISQRIPDADHVRLDDVQISTNVKRGAVISLKGHAKRADVIAELEDSLRFEKNIVEGKIGTRDRNQPEYPWLLDTSVTVEPDGYDRGTSTGRPYRAARRTDAPAPDSPKTSPEAAKSEAAESAKMSTDKDASTSKSEPKAAVTESQQAVAPTSPEGAPAAESSAAAAEAASPTAETPATEIPEAEAPAKESSVPAAAPGTGPEAAPADPVSPAPAMPGTSAPEAAPESPAADNPAPASPAAEASAPATPPVPAAPEPAPTSPAPAAPSGTPATTPPPPDPDVTPPAPAPAGTESVPPAAADESGSADQTEGNES